MKKSRVGGDMVRGIRIGRLEYWLVTLTWHWYTKHWRSQPVAAQHFSSMYGRTGCALLWLFGRYVPLADKRLFGSSHLCIWDGKNGYLWMCCVSGKVMTRALCLLWRHLDFGSSQWFRATFPYARTLLVVDLCRVSSRTREAIHWPTPFETTLTFQIFLYLLISGVDSGTDTRSDVSISYLSGRKSS